MAMRTLIRHFQYLWASFMVRFQLILDFVVQTAGPFYIILAFTLIRLKELIWNMHSWSHTYHPCFYFDQNLFACVKGPYHPSNHHHTCTVIYLFFTTVLPAIHNIFSLQGIIHILISSWLIFNVFFNYLWCIYTDPGSPPSNFDPGADLSKYESATSQIRWCKRCRKPKPPMTHHCHICKRCILKMDHHCPWMHNCIGFHNYRYFFLFLVYMWTGCVYTTLMASIPLFRSSILFLGMSNDSDDFLFLDSRKLNGVLFTFVLALTVLASLSCLLGWHLYLVLTAQTTIDFYANRQRKREGRRIGEVWENEFNMGKSQNFRNTFNLDELCCLLIFLLPSKRPSKGDGTDFPTRHDYHHLPYLSNGGTQPLQQPLHYILSNHSTMGSSSRSIMTLERAMAEDSLRDSDMV